METLEANINTQSFLIGDHFWQGHIDGRSQDATGMCDTKREAESELREMWNAMTDGDRRGCHRYVTRYRVLDLDDDGSVGSAVSDPMPRRRGA